MGQDHKSAGNGDSGPNTGGRSFLQNLCHPFQVSFEAINHVSGAYALKIYTIGPSSNPQIIYADSA